MDNFPYVETLTHTAQSFGVTLAEFIPNFLAALFILFSGWLISRGIRKLTVNLLEKAKFDRLIEKIKIKEFLAKAGIETPASKVIAGLVYLFLMLIVFMGAFNVLGLEIVSTLFISILLYIPKVIAAVAVLVLGFWIADFAKDFVYDSLTKNEFEQASLVSKIAYAIIVIFTFTLVISIIGVGDAFVATAFLLILGAGCLAAAIALGLGGVDLAKRWLEKSFGDQVDQAAKKTSSTLKSAKTSSKTTTSKTKKKSSE